MGLVYLGIGNSVGKIVWIIFLFEAIGFILDMRVFLIMDLFLKNFLSTENL